MALTISTIEYEFAHGRKPRGVGHWAFSPYRSTEMRFANPKNIYWFAGPYSTAKKAAVDYFKDWGHITIYVCS